MKNESLCLNGTQYCASDLAYLRQQGGAAWQIEIVDFLEDWFSDSDSIITLTSGSTGIPKEIRLTKATMRNSARMTNDFLGLEPSHRALLCLPASYIAGKMMLVRAIVGGFDLWTVEPQANPFRNLSGTIDFTAITPYQLFHSAETLRQVQVNRIIVGGGAVSGKLEALASTLSSRVFETYGMTETASHIALRALSGADTSDYFTVLEGVRIRQDERGCLCINAPYLNEEELLTNDLVALKDGNQFKWLGRVDTVINSGGVKLFPEQIEKKLDALLEQRFFISALPDELLGNKLVLVIETKGDESLDLHSLKEAMSLCLSRYELPKAIFCVSEFVTSVSNKILKTETMTRITSPV